MKKLLLLLFVIVAAFFMRQQQLKNTQLNPSTLPATTQDPAAADETNFLDDSANSDTITPQENPASQLTFIASMSGQTALELLQANAQVGTQDYGEAGAFITSINNLKGDNKHYWAFYLNNEYAQKGVSQTILENGDVIKFIYEEIQAAEF